MRKIFVSLLFISLILSSCSIDWNDEKDKKIAELQKQVEDLKKEKENDLFEKKQECSKYKDEMLKFAKNYHSQIYEISEIFYSNVGKSCYFIAKEGVGGRLLFDYLSQSYISGFEPPINCYDISDNILKDKCYKNLSANQIDYDNKIKELKGE